MTKRLVGLAATLGILLTLVGIPVGLFVAAGSPVPGGVPDLGAITTALTTPDDGTLFLALLKVIGWVAWASFAVMVLLEIFARVRGVKAPQLRGLGMQQRAAAGLVGAAALLFTASPLIGAAPATAAPVQHHQVHTSTSTTDAASVAVQEEAAAPVAETAPASTTDYVVKTGDSMYSIAEDLLGDGARFTEIAKLNYGVEQPDGGVLTDSHWIQPGWTLKVPTDQTAAAGGQVTVEAGDTLSGIAQETLGDGNRYPELFEASKDTAQPGGAQLSDPNLIHPGWTITVPGQAAPVADQVPEEAAAPEVVAPVEEAPEPITEPAPVEKVPAPVVQSVPVEEEARATEAPAAEAPAPVDQQQDVDDVDQDAGEDVEEEAGFPVRTAAGIGSLLAAGLLGLIAARRSRQQRRRRPGQDLPMPTGEAAEVEQELRALADPMSVDTVDRALRTLALRCAAESQPLPKVRAARLTADQFDLYLAEPADLPAPWEGTSDSSVWTLTGDADELVKAEDVENVPAPYPALVTVGHDEEDGHVFVDLEYLGAMGVVADAGFEDQTRQAIAALCVELATSRWADDLQVTIVGGYAELEDSLETGRVRYVPSAGRLLEELQHRAEQDRQALTESGAGDLNHARVQNTVPGAWTPEIVLFTGDMTPSQRTMLKQLVEELPRVAIAAVTNGEAVGEWALRITGDQEGVLEPFGLSVRPQLLDDETYGQVLQVLATTDADDETEREEWIEHPEPTLADLEAVMAAVETQPLEAEPATEEVVEAAAEPTVQVDLEQAEPEQDEVLVDQPTAEADDVDEPAEEDLSAADDAAEVEQTVVEARNSDIGLDEAAAGADSPVVAPAAALATNDADSDATPADVDLVDHQEEAEVALMPRRGPRILLLGNVEVVDAAGPVEPSKKPRLTELAAILSTFPGGDHTTIDSCYSPGKIVTDNARNTQMSKLRRWLGKTAEGDDFLPRYQADTGYRLHEQVTSDWQQWNLLIADSPATASTEALEAALKLVRGEPFSGVRARYYSWAESLKQQMICAIIDASYELARRRLMQGRWLAAEEAALIGLKLEPGVEALWRMRILATHERGNQDAEERVISQLLTLADEWGGELEAETEELLEQLKTGKTPSRPLAAGAR